MSKRWFVVAMGCALGLAYAGVTPARADQEVIDRVVAGSDDEAVVSPGREGGSSGLNEHD
jgi:hypothetical protein